MLAAVSRLHLSLIGALLLAACSSESATSADAKREQKGAPGQTTKPSAPEVSGPAATDDGNSLGQLVATDLINLNALVNKTPAEIQAVFGAPTETGSDRISCVRFVPERVFFACEQEVHLYPHATFKELRVEFEDGRAAMVSVAGLPGEGPFDRDKALELLGVRFPGEPRHDNPPMGMGSDDTTAVVDRWDWGNSSARLMIDDLQFRARLTVVNGEWGRAKLELFDNTPLSPEQTARIKPVRGAEAPVSESIPP